MKNNVVTIAMARLLLGVDRCCCGFSYDRLNHLKSIPGFSSLRHEPGRISTLRLPQGQPAPEFLLSWWPL